MPVFTFDMTHDGKETFRAAMGLALSAGLATGGGDRKTGLRFYAAREATPASTDREALPARLVFFGWRPGRMDGVSELPFHLDGVGAADFAMRWLDEAGYPKEPNSDGSVVKGWRLHSGTRDDRAEDLSALLVVRPTWIVYGK